MKIAYKRVSSEDQNLDRQLAGMEFDKEFIDKCSAKADVRPGLVDLIDYVRDHDEIYVHSLDRLARSIVDLRNIIEQITKKNASIIFVKNNLRFSKEKTDSVSNMMLNILGAFAEFERDIIKERQREGIEIAKQKNLFKGGQKKLKPDEVINLKELALLGLCKTRLAQQFNISRQSVYRYLSTE